ncbi:MAG: phosphocholine cytidylyltransferase family protein, partial [Deltaproteobacteria bacterium]|nr:phosphocholine cytidylyltransferase family protein [Deltaproteobacteria bacterium]
MKAIVIAAGIGRRLKNHTADLPKCLVEVAGKPILRHQVEAFRAEGVSRIAVVRGYLARRIAYEDLVYYENRDFLVNNILESLFCAEAEMDGPFLSTYADILFDRSVVRAVLDGPGDICLVVDRQWDQAYDGRTDHPVAEAELTEVDAEGRVLRVGKCVGPEHAIGEFIGLARYSAAGAALMRQVYGELRERYRTRPDEPFQAAPSLRKAYLTDLFQELIARGAEIRYAPIDGH